MTRTITLLALAAAGALAGCNNEDHTIVAGGPHDPMANQADAEPVTLPPSITASHPYRCKDNSLIYIDWMSDGTARVKQERGDVGTSVPVGGENPVLTGDAQAATITYNGQSCSR